MKNLRVNSKITLFINKQEKIILYLTPILQNSQITLNNLIFFLDKKKLK
jgi:hypothetical protein